MAKESYHTYKEEAELRYYSRKNGKVILNNWSRISLVNTDYKTIAHALAKGLKSTNWKAYKHRPNRLYKGPIYRTKHTFICLI